jgi:hypothetical protein
MARDEDQRVLYGRGRRSKKGRGRTRLLLGGSVSRPIDGADDSTSLDIDGTLVPVVEHFHLQSPDHHEVSLSVLLIAQRRLGRANRSRGTLDVLSRDLVLRRGKCRAGERRAHLLEVRRRLGVDRLLQLRRGCNEREEGEKSGTSSRLRGRVGVKTLEERVFHGLRAQAGVGVGELLEAEGDSLEVVRVDDGLRIVGASGLEAEVKLVVAELEDMLDGGLEGERGEEGAEVVGG